MSLEPPAYILSLQSNIRARPISWEGAVRARTISETDLKQIRAIDKVRKEQRRQTVEGDLNSYCELFLGSTKTDKQSIFQSASQAKRVDIIQYLLVLLGDLVEDVSDFTSALLHHPQPYGSILPLLSQQSSNPDQDPIPLLASYVLSSVMSQALSEHTSFSKPLPSSLGESLPTLLNFTSGLAKSADTGKQEIAVRELSALLRSHASRDIFWRQRQDTLNPLIAILRASAGSIGKNGEADGAANGAMSARSIGSETTISGGVNIQLLYHVLLVIWQLSFQGTEVARGLDEEHDILMLYTTLLRGSPKEKITRLLLSTLRNLLPSSTSPLVPSAANSRLPALLTLLRTRKLTDPDLLEDMDYLQNLLNEYSASQTTFSQYAQEVQSGHLRWSPPHKDSNFWKENARRIVEEENGGLVKRLVEILNKSWDSDRNVLAIGCNDVGNLVRECPDKRTSLEKLGLKAQVMQLMDAPEQNIRWEALRATGEWLRYSAGS